MKQDSHSSLQKAAMRPGDHHLRGDARQMFGNYLELAPLGGTEPFKNVRRSAMVVETPVYSEPKLWQIQLLFSAPRGIGVVPPLPLTPWIPDGFNVDVNVTIRAALDRDKATWSETTTLRPLNFGFPNTFRQRFQAAHQIALGVELVGSTTGVLGVQASVVEVEAGERDAYGDAFISDPFQQSAVAQTFLVPNARRRQFFVQNWGTAPLFVKFGINADGPAGGPPSWTVALPARGDIYESPRDCWQGYVSGVWSATSVAATDFAMVTEGT